MRRSKPFAAIGLPHRMIRMLNRTRLATFLVISHLASAQAHSGKPLRGESPQVTVLLSSELEAYQEAFEGLRDGLAQGSLELKIVTLGDGEGASSLPSAFGGSAPDLVVAMGATATQVMSSIDDRIPFVSTMILRSQVPKPCSGEAAKARCVGAVSLDVPVQLVLRELKKLFPDKSRLGVLVNPSNGGPDPRELLSGGEREGFAVTIAECRGPEQLVSTFVSLKEQVDFVWILPDSTLYNATTVKPLIMASLKKRLPIIGFSLSFVRSGAAIGVYPVYREVGRQTAAMIRQRFAGTAYVGEQPVKSVEVAVNERILRLIGLRWESPSGRPDWPFVVR